jgi:hypothetical protein
MPWGMLRLTLVVFAGRQLYVLTHPNHKLHVPFEICLRDSEWDRMPREGPVVQKRHQSYELIDQLNFAPGGFYRTVLPAHLREYSACRLRKSLVV